MKEEIVKELAINILKEKLADPKEITRHYAYRYLIGHLTKEFIDCKTCRGYGSTIQDGYRNLCLECEGRGYFFREGEMIDDNDKTDHYKYPTG